MDKGKDYLKRAESLQPSDGAQNLQMFIQRLESRLKQTGIAQPPFDLKKLLGSANTAFQKGMMMEAAADFSNALVQYSAAKGICVQILNRAPNNADALTLQKSAEIAAARVAQKIQ